MESEDKRELVGEGNCDLIDLKRWFQAAKRGKGINREEESGFTKESKSKCAARRQYKSSSI